MIIIIDLFTIVMGIIIIFGAAMLGGVVDSTFNILTEYIDTIFIVLFIIQLIKHIWLYVKQSKEGKTAPLFVSCGINLFTECIRCLILSVTICNWLSSYNTESFFEMIITGLSFIIDVAIYGIMFLITEAISWYQCELLKDKDYLFFNLLGIINTVVLFVIINISSNGQLVEAIESYLLKYI